MKALGHNDKKTELEETIIVRNLSKSFKIYKDKSHTLKEKVLSRRRGNYELLHVLDNISFSLNKGDAVGLIGHNGSGKSTTLKLLNRILYPEKGTVEIRGKVSSLIELGAGFHPDMTGRENIYINATIFGLKKAEIDRRLDDIIRFSELERYIDNPVRTYSSGMYMRLAFSVAINVDADILLIDEILAVGDANFQRKCFDRLQRIKNEGVTIVIVSHSMDQIRSICNRVIWLENGKIREDGLPRVVCKDYLLAMDERAAERRRIELEAMDIDNPMRKYPIYEVCPTCSNAARREGNMFVRFLEVSLCNAVGDPERDFHIGDDIQVKARLFSQEGRFPDNIVVKVFNQYGGHCLTTESKWEYPEGIRCDGEIRFDLLLKKLNLMPGDYYLECIVFDDFEQVADNLTHFINFSVVPKYGTERDNLGVMYVEHTWNLSKTNQLWSENHVE